MAVTLNFEVNDRISQAWIRERPFRKRGVDLELYSLNAPVTLIVDGVDLIHGEDLPLMSVGPLGLGALLRLRTSRPTAIWLSGGDISFRKRGKYVEVVSGQSDDAATVTTIEYKQLLSAWKEFTESIRRFIVETFPESQDHPDWGPWVRDGNLPPYA